jgi:DNA (cytosine-5)-methyltransferase 1
MESQEWLSAPSHTDLGPVAREVRRAMKLLQKTSLEPGKPYTKFSRSPKSLSEWYRHNADGITLHESRAHMRDDLHRYLFSACFADIHSRSPKLRDFPKELYPSHQNITRAVKGNLFDDRFRVQLADRPSTTITSHVAKDGHYYIHYDPMQCRSLTVREAARLQTFPDSYYFEGTRTEQYGQVGNAVPPLLARDIAGVVFELLAEADRNSAKGRIAQEPRKLLGRR